MWRDYGTLFIWPVRNGKELTEGFYGRCFYRAVKNLQETLESMNL